ncbi:hypothetical protein K432DRAFT_409793 [Lepidopterella palustris CBS 459.81]|uniref:Uncharacterized protein n=1 Tax=Lepidopterella palustris CBS 459.81 TaxID=1314670 RepID=A0A8E2DZF7_9PEZI|nr:hypothetical protein K432DRAFT_409793 [Lepidopterella palustris CBS 459.81]
MNKEATSNLSLDDEDSHRHLLPKGSPFMEGSDFMFLAETEDYDISVVQIIFGLGGGKQSTWQVENDTGMLQTTVIIAPKSQRGVIADNEFIGNRSFATDWEGDVQITRTHDAVVYQLGKIKHVCKPPYWELTGEHNGVEFNLVAGGMGHAVPWKGEWANVATKGGAGYGVPIWVEGTIRANGITHVIKNAQGCRDNFINTTDLAKTYNERKINYYWIWCLDPAMRAMVYHIPGVRTHNEVNAQGEDVPFEDGETEITPLDWWLDPRTGVQVPTRWHLKMHAAAGTTDLVLQGGPRSLYSYLTKSGLSLHVGFLARANGTFTYQDGSVIQIKEAQSYVEWGRALFPLPSGNSTV